MTLESDGKFEKGIDMSIQNWHEKFNDLWHDHSKISKIYPLLGCLWPKYIIFELTKYREVMFDGTEDLCKIWRKIELCFQKWHEEFGKLPPGHSKVSQICPLMGCFWPEYIMFELKKYNV